MIEPDLHQQETERLKALEALKILDTPAEERFDRFTRLVKAFFDTEIVFISLIDANRQWFKSKQGSEACSTERSISFCGHAILQNDIFEIPDAMQDIRFADNPLVKGEPYIRFYAGAPLKTSDGFPIGTLCVIDSKPRQLTEAQRLCLRDFADAVEDELHAIETARLKMLLDDSEKRNQDTVRLLLQKEKLASIGQLAAGVAHEINNPIGFVISNISQLSSYAEGLLQLIKDIERTISEQANERVDKHDLSILISALDKLKALHDYEFIASDMPELLTDCQQGAARVRDIVGSLRSFSESEQQSDKKGQVDINQLVEASLRVCQRELTAQTKLDVRLDLQPELSIVQANQAQLMQVVTNILGNAIHAVEDQGDTAQIIVQTSQAEDCIVVQISDNGVGIPAENRDSIFDPFFTTKAVGRGTGLGLHIAYDLAVNKHGGKLSFVSSVNKGTTFTLEIPVYSQGSNLHHFIPR